MPESDEYDVATILGTFETNSPFLICGLSQDGHPTVILHGSAAELNRLRAAVVRAVVPLSDARH